MLIDIPENQRLALRKHGLPVLRALGVTNPDDFHAHALPWRDLMSCRSAILKEARALADKIKDGTSDADATSIEAAHSAALLFIDEIESEKEARTALGDLKPRAQGGSANRPIPGDGEAPAADDGSAPYIIRAGNWTDRDSKEIRVVTPKDRFATGAAYHGPSLGDCLRAMVIGPRNEAEKRALSEGTNSAGGYTVPTPLAAEFIDKLRAQSVTIRAGARTINMPSETLQVARVESDPTVAWRAENDEISPSDPTFGRVLLSAKSLACLVRVSRELLEDSVNIGAALENAFTKAVAIEFDRAALFGSGSSNQPTGIAQTSGVSAVSMGTNGAALTNYDAIIDAIYAMQAANAADPTGMVFHPRTGAALAKLKDGQANPLKVPEMVSRVPQFSTTSVPINQTQGTATTASSVIFGDFSELLIGLRSGLRIEVLRERYGEFLQYGFIAHMRGDVQLAHTASFSVLKGIIPAS